MSKMAVAESGFPGYALTYYLVKCYPKLHKIKEIGPGASELEHPTTNRRSTTAEDTSFTGFQTQVSPVLHVWCIDLWETQTV